MDDIMDDPFRDQEDTEPTPDRVDRHASDPHPWQAPITSFGWPASAPLATPYSGGNIAGGTPWTSRGSPAVSGYGSSGRGSVRRSISPVKDPNAGREWGTSAWVAAMNHIPVVNDEGDDTPDPLAKTTQRLEQLRLERDEQAEAHRKQLRALKEDVDLLREVKALRGSAKLAEDEVKALQGRAKLAEDEAERLRKENEGKSARVAELEREKMEHGQLWQPPFTQQQWEEDMVPQIRKGQEAMRWYNQTLKREMERVRDLEAQLRDRPSS